MTSKRAKSADQTSFGTTETPGTLHRLPMASAVCYRLRRSRVHLLGNIRSDRSNAASGLQFIDLQAGSGDDLPVQRHDLLCQFERCKRQCVGRKLTAQPGMVLASFCYWNVVGPAQP